jgi:hypothetical protein
MFPALTAGATDLNYIARVITISTGTWFKKIVTKAILELPLTDIETLFAIVKKQTDMERFFFIIVSAKGLPNLTKRQEEQ